MNHPLDKPLICCINNHPTLKEVTFDNIDQLAYSLPSALDENISFARIHFQSCGLQWCHFDDLESFAHRSPRRLPPRPHVHELVIQETSLGRWLPLTFDSLQRLSIDSDLIGLINTHELTGIDAFIERHADLKNITLTASEGSSQRVFAGIPGVKEFINSKAGALRAFWIGRLQVVKDARCAEISARGSADRIRDVWSIKRISFTTVRHTREWAFQFVLKNLPPTCEDLYFSQKESENLNMPQVSIAISSFSSHSFIDILISC